MDDDDSDDELPSISLLSSQDSGGREVLMLSAGAVAEERAQERRTERELQMLEELQGDSGEGGVGMPRSDSSGSETEAALARCVRALRVFPPVAPRPAPARAARALLRALPPPGPSYLAPYIAAVEDSNPVCLKKITNRMITALVNAAAHPGTCWTAEEWVAAAGALCAALLAGGGLRARRGLHAVLQRADTVDPSALHTLAACVSRGAGGGGGAALLALSDALRGGPPPAARLADLLLRRAMFVLLRPNAQDEECSEPHSWTDLSYLVEAEWRRLGAPARRALLRAGARAVRGEGGRALLAGVRGEGEGGRALLLAALAAPPPLADKHHPDYHKVAVAASTLQLLFRTPS